MPNFTVLYSALQCSTAQRSGLCYIGLHCIALHCLALHCLALHCIALHCIALHTEHYINLDNLHCITLHSSAAQHSTLLCVTSHCITLHSVHVITLNYIRVQYIPLRYVLLHHIHQACLSVWGRLWQHGAQSLRGHARLAEGPQKQLSIFPITSQPVLGRSLPNLGHYN